MQGGGIINWSLGGSLLQSEDEGFYMQNPMALRVSVPLQDEAVHPHSIHTR